MSLSNLLRSSNTKTVDLVIELLTDIIPTNCTYSIIRLNLERLHLERLMVFLFIRLSDHQNPVLTVGLRTIKQQLSF